MSSLLQFSGQVTRKGARLEFYHVTESAEPYLKGSASCGDNTDVICLPGGKTLPRIWTAVRKPAGMFGPWVLWRVNSSLHPYDLSCPIATFRLPRDAKPLPIAECIARWQS